MMLSLPSQQSLVAFARYVIATHTEREVEQFIAELESVRTKAIASMGVLASRTLQ